MNKCLKRSENLMELAIDMNQTYRVIMQLREQQEKNNEIINISPAFYNSVFRTHMQSLFIDIAKVFENSDEDDTESVYNLLKKLENNIHQLSDKSINVYQLTHIQFENGYYKAYQSTHEMISSYLQLIEEKECVRKHIKKLRDKHFAHIDLQGSIHPDRLFKKHSVTLDNVEEMLVLYSNICMALYQYFKSESFIPIASNKEDLDKTIKYVAGYFELAEKYNDYV